MSQDDTAKFPKTPDEHMLHVDQVLKLLRNSMDLKIGNATFLQKLNQLTTLATIYDRED